MQRCEWWVIKWRIGSQWLSRPDISLSFACSIFPCNITWLSSFYVVKPFVHRDPPAFCQVLLSLVMTSLSNTKLIFGTHGSQLFMLSQSRDSYFLVLFRDAWSYKSLTLLKGIDTIVQTTSWGDVDTSNIRWHDCVYIWRSTREIGTNPSFCGARFMFRDDELNMKRLKESRISNCARMKVRCELLTSCQSRKQLFHQQTPNSAKLVGDMRYHVRVAG